jgi:hypothetical protein
MERKRLCIDLWGSAAQVRHKPRISTAQRTFTPPNILENLNLKGITPPRYARI